MARRTKPLTATEVQNAKPIDGKSRKLFDGGGLFLLVDKSGSKGWRLKYRYGGREKLISLGVYPLVSLSEARERREVAKKQVEQGIDPSLKKKELKRQRAARHRDTFKALSEEWLSKQNLAASTLKMINSRLKNDINPKIGSVPVADITPHMVLADVLRPMEDRGAVVLAKRVKSIIGQTLRYGVACGIVERDVTADLRGALKQVVEKHRAALTDPKKVGELLRAIDGFEGTAIVKAALLLHPLTAVRPGELRGAEWSEFDLEAGMWIIPAERMKMKVDHVVPLSQQTVVVLRSIYPLSGDGRLVFPSIRTRFKPISNVTMNAAFRRLGFTSEEISPHGWRATFRTLADEVLRERIELIEMQLSHRVRDVHGRAYNRTAFLEERKELMQRWANYLDLLKEGKDRKIIPLKKEGEFD